jgi:hypothetical protein
MLTGALPFTGETSSVLAQQLLKRPPVPSTIQPEIPPAVDQIVLTAIRKVPGNRYPAVEDFIMDLERACGLRDGHVAGEFLPFDDVYEPQTPFGQSMATVLQKKARVKDA